MVRSEIDLELIIIAQRQKQDVACCTFAKIKKISALLFDKRRYDVIRGLAACAMIRRNIRRLHVHLGPPEGELLARTAPS
jgi:hypothetical protein